MEDPVNQRDAALATTDCGCQSHLPADNQGRCDHCGADVETPCGEGCPVGFLDRAQIGEGG